MVYFIKRPDNGRIKIGTTARLSQRLRELAAEYGEGLIVLAVVDGSRDEEQGLHRQFDHLRVVGEWFEPGDDLVGFIVAEGREWDGEDESPYNNVSVNIDSDVAHACRIAAALKGMLLSAYLSETMRDIAEKDIEEGHARRAQQTQAQKPKGKGGSK